MRTPDLGFVSSVAAPVEEGERSSQACGEGTAVATPGSRILDGVDDLVEVPLVEWVRCIVVDHVVDRQSGGLVKAWFVQVRCA